MDDSLRSLLEELEQFGRSIDARTHDRREMMLNVTRDTGALLAILVVAAKARRVLEVGTSNGYSTLWLADAARTASGAVTTVEVAPAKAEMARRNFERAGLTAWITQEVGEADHFLQRQTPASFDLVFLDADRRRYAAWWPRIDAALTPGGLLVVDNAVSHAHELSDFFAAVDGTAGYRTCVVPVGNGEFLALKPPAGAVPEG